MESSVVGTHCACVIDNVGRGQGRKLEGSSSSDYVRRSVLAEGAKT